MQPRASHASARVPAPRGDDAGPRIAGPGLASATAAILLGASLLLWPAFYNGYPLVFADTGTYLSQAIEHYLGWDRPAFYSFFLLPLHLTLTTWPAIVAQAVLTAHIAAPDCGAHCCRARRRSGWCHCWPRATVATALPWFVAQLMPDVFTPLLVLSLALLILTPERLTRWERRWLVVFAAFMIAAQHVQPAAGAALLLAAWPLRAVGCAASARGRRGWARLAVPPAWRSWRWCRSTWSGRGRLPSAPYGNVFLLARVIYDGPGRDVLRQDCPHAGWRLCPWRDRLPPTSDGFLWRPDSPVMLAGGHKAVSAEADAIIRAALRSEPRRSRRLPATTPVANSGHSPPATACTPGRDAVGRWIARDFPHFEYAAYAASRQSRNRLACPAWLQALHAPTALGGRGRAASCCWRPGDTARIPRRGFAAAVLLALLANAAIAGGLSAPHDRYQSRVMLLPPLVAVLGGAALLRDRRRGA